ncbi:hypothetical protein GAYE_SCF18G3846 [Galdieria yellowstonensis]|uniref:FAD-binding domain-containing protein n=1 Tax=Galdieria yellowstonensis TaxID=3028027 RepID=A0AAV9IEW7_9RHOD|nr:hypothetical protein GAYE_SCF18G3846 [Galdieria yellowstonensis]
MTELWISGGGLAGLATFIALKNICGIQANILESKSQLQGDTGTLIALWPNGLRALQAIDYSLYSEILETGCKIRAITSVRGTTESRMPVDYESKYGQPFLCIRWSTLHSLLAKRVPPSRIYLQHTTCQVHERNDRVIIETTTRKSDENSSNEDGEEKEAFVGRALIVADGVGSLIRKYVLNEVGMQHLIDPIYAGRMIVRAVLQPDELEKNSSASIPSLENESIFFFSADGKKVGSLSSLERGQMYWALTLDRPAIDYSIKHKQRLLEESEFSPALTQAIAATPADRIQARPLYEMQPVPRYAKGNVVLIGDAAHAVIPSLGQGANMAFEDALVLSQCIKNEDDNLASAFSSFEQKRTTRCGLVQEESIRAGKRSRQVKDEDVSTTPPFESYEKFLEYLLNFDPDRVE